MTYATQQRRGQTHDSVTPRIAIKQIQQSIKSTTQLIKRGSTMNTKTKQLFSLGATAVLLFASSVFAPGAGSGTTQASSHREAPLISMDPAADTTDVYAFVSPDKPDSVTIIGSWIPLEGPQGGPNYYRFGDDVRYSLHIDNNGDAKPDQSYRFQFTTQTKNANTFLYNVGPIANVNSDNWNVVQTYSIEEENAAGKITKWGENLIVPPVCIGPKSTPDCEKLMAQGIQKITTPEGDLMAFAGPTDDPFWVDLLIFDLLSLRAQKAPVGYDRPSKGIDGLKGFNVHSIALQIPIKKALKGSADTVIGVWATSERRSTKTFSAGATESDGDWVQISRLGMPLVNEVVLPLALKDAFNSLPPDQDFKLATSGTPAGDLLLRSVLTPELQTLLGALYGVPSPGKPRNDLLTIFLTGIKTNAEFTLQTPGGPVKVPAGTNVNQPAKVTPAEMIRLNVAEPFRPGVKGSLCSPRPNYKLGLLGGDACGFPNGRRLQDDVTEIELLAVAGAAYPVVTGEAFNFNPALIKVLNDGIDSNDKPFKNSFPYLATPHRGLDFRSCSTWDVCK
jgi:hypothetical protein